MPKAILVEMLHIFHFRHDRGRDDWHAHFGRALKLGWYSWR
jgi:hypothetical protein